MSYFGKKASCGAPLWQVEGIMLLFWAVGVVGIPLLCDAPLAIDAKWLIALAMISICIISYRSYPLIFFAGTMISFIGGVLGVIRAIS
jgi:hypothetical protein